MWSAPGFVVRHGHAVREGSRLHEAQVHPGVERAEERRAGLIDEYQVVTHPVLVGGGTPFFSELDTWVSLRLVGTRTFPDGVTLSHYEARR